MSWGELLMLLSVIACITGAYCELRLRAREHEDEVARQAIHHRLDRQDDVLQWAQPDVDALRGIAERVATLEAKGPAESDPYPSERIGDRLALLRMLCAAGAALNEEPDGDGRWIPRLREAATSARAALIRDRHPHEHPEDRCEGCRRPFEPWHAPTEEWARVTGRSWGGPIICQACFHALGGEERT